jgi:hypothetical protein
MNVHYTTIKDIASEIYEHPMMRDIPFERIVRDTVELMQIVGCPTLFEQKEATINIHNYKGALPCDYFNVIQVFLLQKNAKVIIEDTRPKIQIEDASKESIDKIPMLENKNTIQYSNNPHLLDTSTSQENTPRYTQGLKAFVHSTDTLSPRGNQLTYKMQGDVIYTSIKEGTILMSYTAIKVDKDGYPLIINNSSYIRALKSYIKQNWFTILFDSGQLHPSVLENAQRDYSYNIAQATNSLIMPTIDQLEVISRLMNASLLNTNAHATRFEHINNNNKLKVH